MDGFGAHQIWYPPPPAYEEEDHSQAQPPHMPVPSLAPGLYPNTRSPDEWRRYPDFPAAYPLSPVLDPMPPPSFRIVAPVPQRPSDVIDIDNMSGSGQDDGNESDNNRTRPGFRRSLLSSRELMNPNSVVRSSDEFPTHGVQLEEKTKHNRRKRKRMALEGEENHSEWKEDGMDVDEMSAGDDAADVEEMDGDGSEDEGYAGDTTFTTPRARPTTMAVDSDAEMGDASSSEREDSFSFQTPFLPRRRGGRTKSNITLNGVISAAGVGPGKNVQDARLKIHTASPPRPLPPHLASQMSPAPSNSSVRSASTTLSTLGGGDSLMTGDGSEREDIETPLSPEFPSSMTHAAGTSSEVSVPFPIPDVDPTLTVPAFVRGKRLFPRTHATSSRSRPPKQCIAITSSSSGGPSSRTSSRSRASRKSQGLHPVGRKKNVDGSGPTRIGVRPVAKGAENVPIPLPIPIPVSDSEDARKNEKDMKSVSGADVGTDGCSDAPSLNKKQKISPTSLRKTSSSESKAIPPLKKRLAAPQKPIRITRSTSSGMSASSTVGARKKVGFLGGDKSAVRTTRVGRRSANESGG